MRNSSKPAIAPRLIVSFTAILGLLGLLPVDAAAQTSLCRGEVVTVDIGAGQLPTDGNDVILGTEEDDRINAGAGDDIVCGLGGDDSIFGGTGNDSIVGGKGRDILTGSLGDDFLRGGRGRDLLVAGPGADTLLGGGGKDWCTGRDDNPVGCEQLYDDAPGEGAAPEMSLPLKNIEVSSRYGPRLHPILDEVRMHNGIDLRAPQGTRIFAAAPGTVIASGKSGGFGKRVVIDHGDGWATLYAHMSKLRVEEGDVVEAGKGIGKVGSTGLSTGPHLHFEVRVGNIRLDPQLFLDFG